MKFKKTISLILAAVISFVSVSGLGYFVKAASAVERHSYQLSLSSNDTVVFADTTKYFLPKKLVQPGNIYITGGHRGGVTNNTGNDVKLRIEMEDTPYTVSLSSKMNGFDSKTGIYSVPVKDGKQVTFDATISIPRNTLEKEKVEDIVFHFIDDNTDEVMTDLIAQIS